MASDWFSLRIAETLHVRQQTQLYRERRVVEPRGGGRIAVDGRELINFGSNDYLGLRGHRAIVEAASAAALGRDSRSPVVQWGAGAAPLLTGRTAHHAALEAALADWKRNGDALTFTSGYATGVSVIPALALERDIIFSDSLNHASLIDGCRLSKATVQVYRHADADDLAARLAACEKQRTAGQGLWIVTDSIFSMEGDAAPLAAIADLAKKHLAGVIVDEAHAGGVYGVEGAGLVLPERFRDIPLITIGTLSKALGSVGGFVASTEAAVDYLRQFARGYIYSTAMPASTAAAGSAAIEICRSMEQAREQLRHRGVQLRRQIRELGCRTAGEDSPIIPIYAGEPSAASRLSARLRERGLWAPPIRPPTVPQGHSLVRLSLSASHSDEDLARLLEALREVGTTFRC